MIQFVKFTIEVSAELANDWTEIFVNANKLLNLCQRVQVHSSLSSILQQFIIYSALILTPSYTVSK